MNRLPVLRRGFTHLRRRAAMRPMKRIGVPALLFAILGGAALSQFVACDETKATAPAASPENASSQPSAAASGASAAPPARHGGGW